jgi:hypothetical protein
MCEINEYLLAHGLTLLGLVTVTADGRLRTRTACRR